MLNLVSSPDPDVWYTLLVKLKTIIFKGGEARMAYTLPTMFFQLLKLSAYFDSGAGHSIEQTENDDEQQMQLVKCDQKKIFKMVSEICEKLQGMKPELAMKLYLQASQAINRSQVYAELEEQAYDFCSNALLIYQDEISDTEAKQAAITLICTTIYNLNCFTGENLDTLLANCMSGCSSLLKKPAQCAAVMTASNLFNS